MSDRAEKIREARLRQSPLDLARKAGKSATRARIWTQEEMDCADAKARKLWRRLHRIEGEQLELPGTLGQ